VGRPAPCNSSVVVSDDRAALCLNSYAEPFVAGLTPATSATSMSKQSRRKRSCSRTVTLHSEAQFPGARKLLACRNKKVVTAFEHCPNLGTATDGARIRHVTAPANHLGSNRKRMHW
jgi:hypothetical protein